MLAVASLLPLLLGGVVLAQAYSNHQILVPNPAFAQVAWHNLRSDQVFPDYVGYGSADEGARTWSRQGIAKETSCSEALRKDFAKVATANDCKTVLRATYVHIGGRDVATLGLIVLGPGGNADAVANEDFDITEAPGPLVYPFAVPGTPAATWTKERAIAGNALKVDFLSAEELYVVAVSVGPVDASRAVGVLPEDFDLSAKDEEMAYWDMSSELVLAFSQGFYQAIRGNSR